MKIFSPLKTVKISAKQQREYHKLHDLIWANSRFGG
jgi:L-rhamnose mutarotase